MKKKLCFNMKIIEFKQIITTRYGFDFFSKLMISTFIILALALSFHSFSYANDTPPSNEDEIRETLSEIVSSNTIKRSENDNKNIFDDLRERIREFIKEKFDEFMNRLNIEGSIIEALEGKSIPLWVIALLKYGSIALIILIIVFIGYYILKNRFISKKIKVQNDEILTSIKDPDLVLMKVQEHMKNGNYNDALRFLYIAALINYNKLNIIKINKAKTNKQYLIEIRQNKPEAFNEFTNFTYDFNKYCYGRRKLSLDKFQLWYDAYFELIKVKGGIENE
ncbi:UNVERIFIED_CONTAM: hypothetical protein Cloal_0738 [Acetivibrio alkalicellulosi]